MMKRHRIVLAVIGLFGLFVAETNTLAAPLGKVVMVLPVHHKMGDKDPILSKLIFDTIPSLSNRQNKASSLYLEDLMLGVACAEETHTCFSIIGQALNADELLLPVIDIVDKKNVVHFRWIDVASGNTLGSTAAELDADSSQLQINLNNALRVLFKSILKQTSAVTKTPEENSVTPATLNQPGQLEITSTIPSVEISLNGEPRGLLPLTLNELAPGTYRLHARRRGYQDWQSSVVVKSGKKSTLDVDLSMSNDAVADVGFFESIRWPTWVTVGLSSACFIAAGSFGADLMAQQRAFDRITDNRWQDIEAMQRHQLRGQRDALAANILLGIGGGLIITSAVLSYFDYRSAQLGKYLTIAQGGAVLRW